jgi:hypothetical protein
MSSKKSRGKKNSPSFWQWLLVAVAAFLLYKGLEHYLGEKKPAPKKPAVTVKAKTPPPSPPAPSPQPTAAPVKKWDFQETAHLLPEGAYQDNFVPLAVRGGELGLIAYAKILAGKKPGPQGLTNTRPGLRWYRWEGGAYRSQELDFSALQEAIGGGSFQKLTGLPELEHSPLLRGEKTLFLTRLSLGEDPMEAIGVTEVDEQGIRWAPAQGPDGKIQAAAFLKGTTRLSTRNVLIQTYDRKTYIVVEQGRLDEKQLHLGYQWKVAAYVWDGKAFVYDKEYSEKLTKEKSA